MQLQQTWEPPAASGLSYRKRLGTYSNNAHLKKKLKNVIIINKGSVIWDQSLTFHKVTTKTISFQGNENFLPLLKLLISDCFQMTFIYIILWTENWRTTFTRETNSSAYCSMTPDETHLVQPPDTYPTVSNWPAVHKILHQNLPPHWHACSHYFVFDVRTDWASIINFSNKFICFRIYI